MAREQVSRYYYQRQVARWKNLSFRSKTLMRGLHIRAGEKKVRATMTARRCSQHASSRRKNRVVGKEEEGGEKKKKERKKREAIVDVSSRLVERRSPDTGGMLVRRAGELFRKQARPSPSSNGRESISGPSPVERKELLPTGQDLCPTYI